jgi:hypothetical protein
MSEDTRLGALAELRCHGVRLVDNDHADDGATLETGGLAAAA